MDGDAANLVTVQLDLAGVEPDAHVDADSAHGVPDGASAAHGPSGSIEGREEPVARGADLSTAEAFELGPREAVVVAMSSDHRRSPMPATWSVEPTTSVNSTVASTRST